MSCGVPYVMPRCGVEMMILLDDKNYPTEGEEEMDNEGVWGAWRDPNRTGGGGGG